MRIRKRKVPFPLSSLSPIPLSSDPHLSQSSVVQLEVLLHNPHQNLSQESDKHAYFNPQLSDDQFNQPIGGGSNGQDCSAGGPDENKKKKKKKKKKKQQQVLLQEGDEKVGDGEKSNDTRKGTSLGAEMETNNFQQLSNYSHQVGRWCEREKVFPLKKRRGSFERRSNEVTIMEKDKKMKIKMNKKCVQQNGNEGEEEDKETKEGVQVGGSSVKRRARRGALMEGSRCSRVNGRGWRCCQQTLVGYSLCEHHLGKGRLRSMNSVRSRSTSNTAQKKVESKPLSSPSLSLEAKETTPISSDSKVVGENEDADEKKPLMVSKKKMKLGMVKARSISSLLGQANDATAIAENNK